MISELSEDEKVGLASRPKAHKKVEPVPTPALTPVEEPVVVTVADPALAESVEAAVVEDAVTEAVPAAEALAENPEDESETAPEVVPNQCVMMGPISGKQYDQIAQRLLARTVVPSRRAVEAEGIWNTGSCCLRTVIVRKLSGVAGNTG